MTDFKSSIRDGAFEQYKPKYARQAIDAEPARPDMLAELASLVRSLTYGEAMQLESAVGGFDKLHKWAMEYNEGKTDDN